MLRRRKGISQDRGIENEKDRRQKIFHIPLDVDHIVCSMFLSVFCKTCTTNYRRVPIKDRNSSVYYSRTSDEGTVNKNTTNIGTESRKLCFTEF